MMKFCMTALIVFAIAGSATIAQAKGDKANKKNAAGADSTGSIVSVAEVKDKAGTYDVVLSAGKGKKAQTVTMTADSSTKVNVNGIASKPSDLKAGQKATWSPSFGTLAKLDATDAVGKKGGKKNK